MAAYHLTTAAAAATSTATPALVDRIYAVTSVSGGLGVGGTVTPEFTPPGSFDAPGDFQYVGGVQVGGEPIAEFSTPEEYSPVFVRGGVSVGGVTFPTFIRETTYSPTVYGGVQVGGHITPTFSYPGAVGSDTYAHVVSGGLAVGGAVRVGFVSPGVYAHEVTGGVRVSGPVIETVRFTSPEAILSSAISSRGGISVGGSPVPTFIRPESFQPFVEPRLLPVVMVGGGGGASFIIPPTFRVEVEGGVAVGPGLAAYRDPIAEVRLLQDEVCSTWVLSGMNYEASIFTGWNFNSYTIFQGKALAARVDGLYLLEGEDDNGYQIRSGVRLKTNFGSNSHKRLRAIDIGPSAGSQTKARVATEVGGKTMERVCETDRGGKKIPVARDIHGEVITIDIQDFDELSQLEILPMVLSRA